MKLAEDDFFNANKPEYLDMFPEVKEEILQRERKCKPRFCVECLFYSVGLRDNGVIAGKCAAKWEIEKENFADITRRADGCPLDVWEESVRQGGIHA